MVIVNLRKFLLILCLVSLPYYLVGNFFRNVGDIFIVKSLLHISSEESAWPFLAIALKTNVKNSPRVAWSLGYYYESIEQYDAMVAEWRKLNSKDLVFLTQRQILLGETAYRASEFQRALEMFRAATRLDHLSIEGYLGLAKSLSSLGDVASSLNVLENANRIMPNNESILVALGDYYIQSNNFASSLEAYNRALVASPNSVWPLLRLCSYYLKMGNLESAKFWCQKAIDSFSDNYWGNFLLGQVYFAERNYESAIKSFKSAEVIVPNDPAVHGWLGIVYMELPGHCREAQLEFEAAFSLARREDMRIYYLRYLNNVGECD